MESIKPYLVMVVVKLCLAVFMALLHSVVAQGSSSTVLVVYENILSSILLCSVALLFEREKRPKPSLGIICWAFFVGALEVPLGQLLLTSSLRYITVSFQSVAMNTIPVQVFVLAVAARREPFRLFGLHGQAKLWGILTSAVGATIMVITSRDKNSLDQPQINGSSIENNQYVGFVMVGVGVLAQALGSFFVEQVTLKYPAVLTLSAMMNLFGMIQTAALASLMERNLSAWRINWNGSLQLVTILYGGIGVAGLSYYAQNWCIKQKGPVFASSFLPLLIVFSFLLDKLVTGTPAHLGGTIGAALVIGGLYLLLWAKSKDNISEIDEGQENVQGCSAEPLLPEKVQA